MGTEKLQTLEGGAFQLLDPIGHGGVGIVYRGRQRDLDRDVAIKLLIEFGRSGSVDRETLLRFQDEAQAAARVRHPQLVEIISSGIDAGAGPYIVYEYLGGGSLADELAQSGPMNCQTAFDTFGKGILSALAALHGQGIVHRDLKPANILKNDAGNYLLADLGLASFEGRGARTKTGMFLGTPGYVAPERTKGGSCTAEPAEDMYAFAVLFIEAVTGKIPFASQSTIKTLQDQLARDVTPRQLRALGIPRRLAQLLAACLVRDPAQRSSSATTLQTAMAEAIQSLAQETTKTTIIQALPQRTGATDSRQPGAIAPGQPGTAAPGQPGTAAPGKPGTAAPGKPGTARSGYHRSWRRPAFAMTVLLLLITLCIFGTLHLRGRGETDGLTQLTTKILRRPALPSIDECRQIGVALQSDERAGLVHLIETARTKEGNHRRAYALAQLYLERYGAKLLDEALTRAEATQPLTTLVDSAVAAKEAPQAATVLRKWLTSRTAKQQLAPAIRTAIVPLLAALFEASELGKHPPRLNACLPLFDRLLVECDLAPDESSEQLAHLYISTLTLLRQARTRKRLWQSLESLADKAARTRAANRAIRHRQVAALAFGWDPAAHEQRRAEAMAKALLETAPTSFEAVFSACSLAHVQVRITGGTVVVSDTKLNRALQTLEPYRRQDELPRPLRNLVDCVRAGIIALADDEAQAKRILAAISPEQMPREWRWWYYWSMGWALAETGSHGQAAQQMSIARSLAEPELRWYLTLIGEGIGATAFVTGFTK